MHHSTYVEINMDNINNNVNQLIKRYNNYQYYFGVLEKDAYGHGLVKVAEEITKQGINYLVVSTFNDAIEIRKKMKYVSILCLDPVPMDDINTAIKNNITITISSYAYYQQLLLKKVNSNLKVHLKLDTGLNLLGIKNKIELDEIFLSLINHKKIILEGLYMDLIDAYNIDGTIFDDQINKFLVMTKDIDLEKIPIIHLYDSGALLSKPKLKMANGVRLGICMFGINPVKHKELDITLRPSFTLYSEIIEIKRVKTGETIGFNNEYQAKMDMLIGILPIGFADGISRNNNERNVSINGVRYKIVGNISMDYLAVYIDENINIGDKVALIGEVISTTDIATYLNITEHEVITSIDSNIPRIHIKNEKEVK